MFIYEPANTEIILIHLHGFASNVQGSKISILRDRASKGKFSLFAMDMEYQKTTTTKVLEVLDALVKGFSQKYRQLWLSGSSHGGYVSLNYLRFYKPNSVKKVFLFAPSYTTLQLTLQELGEDRCKAWLEGKEDLKFVECETGLEITINREFAIDILSKSYEIISQGKVLFPKETPYEIYVFHGSEDEVVPVEHSRLFTDSIKVKVFEELHDDHRLTKSFEDVVERFLS
ncbi:MAG: alpha/beta hydrolase [Aquificaceae bacterium]|nr:alpha/beta hydrolase [Aquificaceae bacterium]